jgi:nitroreductase
MSTFLELVSSRQSVRRYDGRKIEKEKLSRCLEAARLAPSASNSQPWKYIVIDDPELKNKVAKQTYSELIAFNKFALQAPVIIVIVLEKPKTITRIGIAIKKKEWPLIDIGVSAEHFCLQAAEEGLGTCMLGWFNEKPIKKLLGVPEKKSVALLITVGYPVNGYPHREKIRKRIEEVCGFNGY